MFPQFGSIEHNAVPYEHFVGHCVEPGDAEEWLDWFETAAPWRLVTTDFYEQYEFSLLDACLAPEVECLACPEALTSFRSLMVQQFHEPLCECVDVTAHKLVTAQTIRIHNDFIPGGGSHRILLQLNRGWDADYGGYLMLFSGPEPKTISKIVEPMHRSVQAFAISPRSYHAVSTVHRGERFTVVYSFYRQTA